MPQRRLASHQLSLPRCSKHDMEKAWKSWRLHQLLSRLEANHIWLYEMRTQDGKQATEKSLLGMTLASQFGCKIVRSWTAKLSPNPAAAASMAAAGRQLGVSGLLFSAWLPVSFLPPPHPLVPHQDRLVLQVQCSCLASPQNCLPLALPLLLTLTWLSTSAAPSV